MKRPTKEIEQLRRALIPGVIDPKRIYELDLGDGQVVRWTGAELLETATTFIEFADCEKKGDRDGMLTVLQKARGKESKP